jgi:hypothetical protein
MQCTDDARSRPTSIDGDTHFCQPSGNKVGGVPFFEGDLRMSVKIMPPSAKLCRSIQQVLWNLEIHDLSFRPHPWQPVEFSNSPLAATQHSGL